MAKIVMGVGISHSPMMAMDGKYWSVYHKRDQNHKALFDESGNHVTFEELNEQRGSRYKEEARPERLASLYDSMEEGFNRLKKEISHVAPDVMVVISNDHPGEFFDGANVPSLGIYCDDKLISARVSKNINNGLNLPQDVLTTVKKMMGMDTHNVWPGSREFAEKLVEKLTERDFEISILREQKDPENYGHGHGFGMVVTKLMDKDQLIPMVPIYLNTWKPNVLSISRCYDFGRAIRKAIEEIMPSELKVCLVASGGLSHFVTDVGLDELVLNAIRDQSEADLRQLPEYRMNAGSAEIRNWVVLAAASEKMKLEWDKYLPVFRTPAGTGIGITFAKWS